MPKHKFKDKDSESIEQEIIPRNIARFGSSLFMKGELSGDEDLVIEGQFEGKIELWNHNILVDHRGKVEAEIRVKNITINGSVKGNIHASGKVFISKEGQMEGDIIAPTISIVDGAQFKGSVKMEKEIEHISPPQEEVSTLPLKEEGVEEKEEREEEKEEEKKEVEEKKVEEKEVEEEGGIER